MPAKKSLKPSAVLQLDQYALTELDKERFEVERKCGIVPPDSPVLSRPAAAIDPDIIETAHIQEICSRLFAIASGQQQRDHAGKAKRTLVGLSAPQVGESLRIVIIDTKMTAARRGKGRLECFINPEIIWRSVEQEESHEGCFSAGPVWGLIKRPLAVKIQAYTLAGKRVERIFEGFTARITSHEIDHLNGIRFADKIKNDKKRHWVHTEELATYRKNPKRWLRHCSQERWEALKAGRLATSA